MSQNPTETLFTHFAYYLAETNFGYNDWRLVASEYGVNDTASKVDRFYRSWHWGDDDRIHNTVEFLRRVHDENPDTAYGLMKRAYSMTKGADEEQVKRYPSIEALEAADIDIPGVLPTIRTGADEFIDVNNPPGQFYPDLVDNINLCYLFGIYDATFVLTRKLLENLLIDILREKYGTNQIDLYYNSHRRQFQPFSTLVDNFEDNLSDFKHISGSLDSGFIDDLNNFRQTANANAHGVDVNINEKEIQGYQEQAEYVSRMLFRVYSTI